MPGDNVQNENTSVIGAYGKWAASINSNKLPSLSFRNNRFTNVDAWRQEAKTRLIERMAIPDIGPLPTVSIKKEYDYDSLHIEELSWQLPYGPPTNAILLKPQHAVGKLPGIIAFHDHSALKYFGAQKITRTSPLLHPAMKPHQQLYYSDLAWANEISKRGYIVLVHDAFPFASRRVMIHDIPAEWADGLSDDEPENIHNIDAYNQWAANHEHTMAKSLFSAGTTWPGVFFTEDKIALDVLCARPDVDTNNLGCGGLSGGGMRTAFLAGIDERVKCAVCAGFMTTWKDFVLSKSPNHTWMTYVPLLPNDLDFPEILSLHAPLPAMVLNNTNDELFTLDEMQAADNVLSEVYDKAGAHDRYKSSFHPGAHKFDVLMQEEAFNWFDKWLKQKIKI